jgi:diacylglycerol kinase (ATP)
MMDSKVQSQNALAWHARRLVGAARYSWQGIAAAWRGEAAFRLEMAMLAVALPLAAWLPVEPASRGLMMFSALMIPAVELMNSGLEALVDRVGTERHELSGRAKDMGSAAVLFACLGAVAAWACALWPLARLQ